MIHLTIDGRPVEVPPGATILAAARELGIAIPSLCYVPGFEPAASCFLCAVAIEGRSGFWPSCALPAAEGMVVWTQSEPVRAVRKTALELLLSDHVGDCIGPCRTGCPARLDIPGFISRLAEADVAGAAELVNDDLIFPASLGRVCPRLCEEKCRQCEATEALSIRNLHRFAADHRPSAGPRPALPQPQPTGKGVAIVGAGPAGLTAASRLLRLGHRVVLFDAHPHPGGMLRYGIPAFRLPRAVLQAEIAAIERLGATFRLGKKLGHDFSVADLRRDFDAVFLALGAQGSRGLGCPGEELALPALDFLGHLADEQPVPLGPQVVVVGGGNTAMDAARCAVRLGAGSVRVIYRRTRKEMPCLLEEVEAAEAEGVELDFLVAPTRLERRNGRLELTCLRMDLGSPDASGRARPIPIPGSEFHLSASSVIAAIGQTVDSSGLGAPDLAMSKWGIAADPSTLVTSLPGVFAGGDAVTGPDLAVRAVAAGKLAASSIHQYLSGQKVVGTPEPMNILMGRLSEEELAVLLRGIDGSPRAPMPQLPLERRRHTFDEVELGLSTEAAAREARRCIRCGCGKAIPCRLRQLATEYAINPQRIQGERRRFRRDTSHPEIIYEPGKCILCGACLQIATQAGEQIGVAFVGRGFQVSMAGPFSRPMAESFRISARRAAEVCPTGALLLKGSGCAACRRA